MKKRNGRILLGGLALAFGLLTGCGAADEAREASTEDNRSGVGYFADEMSKAAAENSAKLAQKREEARSEGEGDTVKIRSVDDLISFRERINGGEPAVDAVLEADLDLSSVCGPAAGNWEPILKYNGTFEGNGHTISNLYFSGSAEEAAGLFGTTDVDSVIQNLSVADAQISGGGYTGAVVGSSQGRIRNCQSSGSVSSSNQAVGGIAGRVYRIGTGEGTDAAVSGCVNYAAISNTGTTKCIAGGVVGQLEDVGASDCRNEGPVSGTASFVGGVFGTLLGSRDNPAMITDCVNTADVDGRIYVGGLCSDAEFCVLNRCKNSGSVTGYIYVGGLCGYFGGEKSKNRSLVALMENCSSEGTVSLNYMEANEYLKTGIVYENQQAGGLAAVMEAALVLNSRNGGDLICGTGKNFQHCGAGYLAVGKYQGARNLLLNCVSTGRITPPEDDEYFENVRTATGKSNGHEDSAMIFYAGDKAAEEIDPTEDSAFTDGTVLAALNGFPEGVPENLLTRLSESGFEYELSGWKAGTDGFPVLEWE